MIAAVIAWGALVGAGWLGGTLARDAGTKTSINAPPLFGEWDLQIDAAVLIPALTAAVLIAALPVLTRRLSWRALLVVAALSAALWPVALAATEGLDAVANPLENRNGYLVDVPKVDSAGELLRTFTDRIDEFATHVRGHPPGLLLTFWSLDRIGLGGSAAAAVLVLAFAASAVIAILICVRALGGEAAARRIVPYLVLLPGAVWIATTGDALFMGAAAWAICLTVLAVLAEGRRADLFAVGGGLLFGATLMLSYGLILAGAAPLAVAIAMRRARSLVIAALTVAAVLGAVAAAGFWWLDGLETTRGEYMEGISQTRSYWLFALVNLSAFALAAGPATAAGLARLRERGVWLVVGGGLAAIALADLSGMSKGEAERIWLPFMPWVAVAACGVPDDRATIRLLLAAQALVAIAIQVSVRMPW